MSVIRVGIFRFDERCIERGSLFTTDAMRFFYASARARHLTLRSGCEGHSARHVGDDDAAGALDGDGEDCGLGYWELRLNLDDCFAGA